MNIKLIKFKFLQKQFVAELIFISYVFFNITSLKL